MNKTIIIKIGTSSITKDCEQGINLEILESLAKTSAKILKNNYRVAIVSSGAMGLGLTKIGAKNLEEKLGINPSKPNLTSYKQALTSIGQVELMKEYQRVFAKENIQVGQVLVSHFGIKDDQHNSTIRETLEKMFTLNILPVINANDTVSSKQIVSGDNDSLAARISILLEAERLFLLTDVDGLYTKDPNKHKDAKLIEKIESFDKELLNLAGDSSSNVGTGGMRSKINAAAVCQQKGIRVEILDARHAINLDKFVFDEDHSMKSTTIVPN